MQIQNAGAVGSNPARLTHQQLDTRRETSLRKSLFLEKRLELFMVSATLEINVIRKPLNAEVYECEMQQNLDNNDVEL